MGNAWVTHVLVGPKVQGVICEQRKFKFDWILENKCQQLTPLLFFVVEGTNVTGERTSFAPDYSALDLNLKLS